jgi:hypothetical protein
VVFGLMLMKSVVGVAQLVEPRIVIPVVVGSSPIVHPTDTLNSPLQVLRFNREELSISSSLILKV